MDGLKIASGALRYVRRRLRAHVGLADTVIAGGGADCPIGWKPWLFAPVFYGYADTRATFPPEVLAAAAGPETVDFGPGLQVRIFYPSLDGSPHDAPLLEGCGRYPLVVFAHGECGSDVDHYQKWFELPATLARSGFVVVVPKLSGAPPGGNDRELEMLRRLPSWARNRWQGRASLMPAPATALVGHSHGGGNTSRVAMALGSQVAAYVSLSGVSVTDVMRSGVPKLFMVGGDLEVEVLGVTVSNGVESLAAPAHYVVLHEGGHWDYLPRGRSSCEVGRRGPCSVAHQLTADMVACFLTRYVRPEGVPSVSWGPFDFHRLHPSLRPPALWRMLLDDEQRFFAGGHLVAWGLVPGASGCGLTSSWKVPTGTGSLVHG